MPEKASALVSQGCLREKVHLGAEKTWENYARIQAPRVKATAVQTGQSDLVTACCKV